MAKKYYHKLRDDETPKENKGVDIFNGENKDDDGDWDDEDWEVWRFLKLS